MVDKTKLYKSAFPVHSQEDGMSVLDWFAGQVLPAILTINSKLHPDMSVRDLTAISVSDASFVAEYMELELESFQ
jgi:hypothetical protein